MRYFNVTVILLLLLSVANSYKILLYSPNFGRSHINFFGKIADVLLDAGHEVVFYIADVDAELTTNGTKRARVIRAKVNTDKSLWAKSPIKENPFDPETSMLGSNQIKILEKIVYQTCKDQLIRKTPLVELKDEKFDVAMAEFYDFCAFGIFKWLQIPAQILVSAVPMIDNINKIFGIPIEYSYVPNCFGASSDDMSYFERVMNIVSSQIWQNYIDKTLTMENELFRKYVDKDFPCLNDLAKQTALAFINSEEQIEFPRPISHKIIYIGGMAVPKHRELTQEFTKILQESKKGAILLSFGSLAESTTLPLDARKDILETFAQFGDYNFIWKYEEPEEHAHLFTDYPNVFPMKWLPQVDLLNDEKVRAFITHGGLNSVTEAIHSGTPMLAIPLFGDQEHNVAAIVRRRVGVQLNKAHINTHSLTQALKQLLQDDTYAKNAKRMAAMLAKKPIKPKELVVKWTEFVAEFQDLSYLDLAGRDFHFIKYLSLDIFLPFIFIALLSLYALFKFIQFAVRTFLPKL